MRRNCTRLVCACIYMVSLLLPASCNDELIPATAPELRKVTVGFHAGGAQTRTEMLPNGLSAAWTAGDQIAVWAVSSSGSYTLSNQIFRTYAIDGKYGYFTSELDSPMPEDKYTYYCCYPAPVSMDGTTATFRIPAVQDGSVSDGADIMVADPTRFGPLRPVTESEGNSGLSMKMNRMMHQFMFMLDDEDNILGDEEIERIFLTFPKSVAGDVWIDITDPTWCVIVSGYTDMTLMLSEPLSREKRNHACLAFAPTRFSDGQYLQLMAYTRNKIVMFEPVYLNGKNCLAGHTTPVRLVPSQLLDYGRVNFTVTHNNIGEDVKSVTLTAPEGCVWGDTGSNVFKYNPGYLFSEGETFEIVFENPYAYWNFGGKSIKVTYDTEHVTTTETVVLPDTKVNSQVEIRTGLPYLLYEDFTSVSSFSSGDKYSTSNAGDLGPYSFLNGWTGGRIGAEASKCIRIACRRETSADYHARVDSAPIVSLKKTARLSVTFDYGMSNEFGGLSVITNPDVGQTYYVGYVTDTKGYSSGDKAGVFEAGNGSYLFEKTGSYSSTPNTETYYLNNVPTGTVRITWRTEVQHMDGVNNTTCWLYIDNVKVQIANNL